MSLNCPACKESKTLNDFYPKRQECKQCQNARRSGNRRKQLGVDSKRGTGCCDCGCPRNKANMDYRIGGTLDSYCRACKKIRNRTGNKYGTKADFERLMKAQKGQCYLCDSVGTDIDHNHETGTIRRLLCESCNAIVGRIENNKTTRRHEEKYYNYILAER